jgi:type IV pilus assembly protein PilO
MARSFHELSARAQVAAFVMVCGLTVAAAWQTLLAPDRLELATRAARLSAVQADVARAAGVAQQLPRIEREVAALGQALDRTTAVLPDEKDAQDVLRQLHVLATESSLALSSFTPKPVSAKAQYAEWPIELGLEGNYHDLGRFFDRVANLPLLISISDLHLKTQTQTGAHGSIVVSCVATTYVFRHGAAAGPAGVKP